MTSQVPMLMPDQALFVLVLVAVAARFGQFFFLKIVSFCLIDNESFPFHLSLSPVHCHIIAWQPR